MTMTEASKIIGERAEILVQKTEIKKQMLKMLNEGKTKEEVQSWVYRIVIGTLFGR